MVVERTGRLTDEFERKVNQVRLRLAALREDASPAVRPEADLLADALEEMSTGVEEMRVLEEELRQQNDELYTAQTALAIERQRYQDLFEFAPDAYLVTDARGGIHEANRAAAALLEVAPGYLPGKLLANFVPMDERSRFRQQLLDIEQTEGIVDWEMHLQPRRGAAAAISARVRVVRPASGAGGDDQVMLRWLLRDVTEHRRAEETVRQARDNLEVRVAERTAGLDAANRNLEQTAAALRRERELLEKLIETVPVGIAVVQGRDHRYILSNPAHRAIRGSSSFPIVGRRVTDVTPAALAAHFVDRIDQAYRTGQTVRLHEIEASFGPDQEPRIYNGQYVPLRDASGQVESVMVVVADVTEEVRTRRRDAFLAEAGNLLAESLDPQAVLDRAASLAVPALADYSLVFTLGPDEGVEHFAVAHADADKVDFVREIVAHLDTGSRLLDVLHSGESRLVPEVGDSASSWFPTESEAARLVRQLAPRSVVVVPLVTAGRTAGGLAWVAAESGRRFGPADLTLARDLAQRVTLAVDNARLYAAERAARVEAEAAARAASESEARYHAIGQTIPFGVWTTDGDGVTTYLSDSFLDLVGMTLEECQKVGWETRLSPEEADHMRAAWQECVEHGTFWDYEYQLRSVNGEERAILSRGAPVRDQTGRVASWVGINLDITERKRVEEALRESEARFRRLTDANIVGILVANLAGRIVEANDAFLNMLGYSRADFQSGRIHWTDLTPAEYRHLDERALGDVWAFGACAPYEKEYIRRDGSRVPVLVGAALLSDRTRQWMYFVVDLTERKRAEEVLRTARDELELRVKERTAELAQANAALQVEIGHRRQAEALLEQRVDERTRELSTLLEISQRLSSTLELQPLLDVLLDQLKAVVDYTGVAVLTLEGTALEILDYRGPLAPDQVSHVRLLAQQTMARGELWSRHEPVIINDVRDGSRDARFLRRVVGEQIDMSLSYVRSWLGVPLLVKDRPVGLLSLDHDEANFYTSQHARLAAAIASHAALAIENARLYEQTHRLAAIEERQRLARELHDSVSQALYGIALGTRTAAALADRDPSQMKEPLNYVLALAQAGLAEMRALIFELRPESLRNEGLIAALAKQAASLRARHGLDVRADLCDEPDAPFEVKEALYLIAREALHNTAKHARAQHVELSLDCHVDRLRLEVADDGVGFDPTQPFPGHLGLQTMRERSTRLGGTFYLESQPGSGMRIRVEVPFEPLD